MVTTRALKNRLANKIVDAKMKEICHVCKKEKKPYTVILRNDILSILHYQQAREDGPICDRCDKYFAMTGEFKNASKEEFEIAKKAIWFTRLMTKWWEKGGKIKEGESKRDWDGTVSIAKWCRNELGRTH